MTGLEMATSSTYHIYEGTPNVSDLIPGDYVGPIGGEFFEIQDGDGGCDFIQLPLETVYIKNLGGISGFAVFEPTKVGAIEETLTVQTSQQGTRFVRLSKAFNDGDEVTVTRKRDDNR